MYRSYILILKLNKNLSIIVGKLGNIEFKKGFYIYIGSGKKNIEKRVERHIKRDKKTHWHIDYLTKDENFSIIEIYLIEKFDECEITKIFIKNGISFIKNFGSTDCNCSSHLFYSKSLKDLKTIIKSFKSRLVYELSF